MNPEILVQAFVLGRIAHLQQEAERQPNTGYAQIQRWRLMEAQYILAGINKILGPSAEPSE